jgi:Zn ribbon nucleic-acid-binding protein
MAKMICPYCSGEIEVDDIVLLNMMEEESPKIECEICGKEFEIPDDVREDIRKRNIEDLAMLDFATDDELNGNIT